MIAGKRVHKLCGLLADLDTIAKNLIQPYVKVAPFEMLTPPTAFQRKAVELLGICLSCTKLLICRERLSCDGCIRRETRLASPPNNECGADHDTVYTRTQGRGA